MALGENDREACFVKGRPELACPLLIVIITIMILISIRPYDVRKIFGLVAAMVCLSTVTGFAQSLLLSVPSTPYDRQMSRIQPVLFTKSALHNNLSIGVVNSWMKDLRGIPYGYQNEWKTPQEVETAAAADCKGKAVALYEKMRENGAANVRLVIGKRAWTSRKTHAWLEWSIDGNTYVLDPTWNWSATAAPKAGSHAYIPLYAYAGSRKFRATTTTTLLAKN